jgi:hypothetical protein
MPGMNADPEPCESDLLRSLAQMRVASSGILGFLRWAQERGLASDGAPQGAEWHENRW